MPTVADAQVPRFDADSVKPNTSGSQFDDEHTTRGYVHGDERDNRAPDSGSRVVLPFQVAGGPGWVGSERFDIVARPRRMYLLIESRWSSGDGTGASDDPTIFTGLQEQVALRLRSSSGPVEMLVIDSIERPSPD